jgi:hypothetical protein
VRAPSHVLNTAYSKKLLPVPYQQLMSEKESPIFHFYPSEFKTDLNGKKQEWEAVVLIPFIDEVKWSCTVVAPTRCSYVIYCIYFAMLFITCQTNIDK